MTDPDAVRAVVILRERPTPAALMALHRLLGLGLGDVRARAEAGAALIDAELFGNDHDEAAALLHRLLDALAGLDHVVHVRLGDEEPGPENEEAPETLRNLLDAHGSADRTPCSSRAPEPDALLVDAIADAARRAIEELRAAHPGPFCAYALVTTGEGLRPYLAVTLEGEHRWDLADGPHAIVGDELLARTAALFDARGDLHRMTRAAAEEEHALRLASMEAALRRLDAAGLFGTGAERGRVLLLVATMPPDESDAAFARRLNPPGPLLDAWLREAAEGA